MDEKTKAIVASNLTIAYFQSKAAQPISGSADQDTVLSVYRGFLASLDEQEKGKSSTKVLHR